MSTFILRHGPLLLALCACGSGGTEPGGGDAVAEAHASFVLLAHAPAADATQVALTGPITLTFNAQVAVESLGYADCGLWLHGEVQKWPGQFVLVGDGTTVRFEPDAPLRAASDYRLSLSPLCCDKAGRILDLDVEFGFRTFDDQPPTLTHGTLSDGMQGTSRTGPYRLTFDEPLDQGAAATAAGHLLEDGGRRHELDLTVEGADLVIRPAADLPGGRQFALHLESGLQDRGGNPIAWPTPLRFGTAADTTPPAVLAQWPAHGAVLVSPRAQPTITFDGAMDPVSLGPDSVRLLDPLNQSVPVATEWSRDRRTLRLAPAAPLEPGRTYAVAVAAGAQGVADASGNRLLAARSAAFATGTDTTGPGLAAATPTLGMANVSPNAEPTLVFDEAIDPASLSERNVRLLAAGQELPCVLTMPDPYTVRLQPVLPLQTAREHAVLVQGGPDGLRDLAGNLCPEDLRIAFATSGDAAIPQALLQPADGAVGVPRIMRASIVFDAPIDPATVDASSCQLRADDGQPLPCTITLENARAIWLMPQTQPAAGVYLRTFVRGGPAGVRTASGNWLDADRHARWRVGTTYDAQAPTVRVSLNGIAASRQQGLVLPPAGFVIEVEAEDGLQAPDLGSLQIELRGPTPGPDSQALVAAAELGPRTARLVVGEAHALATGSWTLVARVADLAGNLGASEPIAFEVATPLVGDVPFERVQVVHVRADLDRDGNGRPDFDDDMLRLGFATDGDPVGTHAYVRGALLAAILGQAHRLYGRGADGRPTTPDSVRVRLVAEAPIRIPHMQMALGGLDPQGARNREFGDPSTGVLGRAYFDHKNSRLGDQNTGTSPGLGVFPAEMLLFQASLHLQVWPSFQTRFAQRFLPLIPAMGGVPAGSHPLDAVVLQEGFDPATATGQQHARWWTIQRAIEEWGLVIGTILAHEIGHSIGLVAPGPSPAGLFGDASLHNSNSSAAEVMAPAVGYEAMVSLPYGFRDINLAYLQQRILLR